MSVVSDLIFHNAKHYITSPFGPRESLTTSNGNTGTMHNGVDYGTNGVKRKQYAIEEGKVLTAATASDGAKYVWVEYPRLGVKMLHYHLDTIKVKAGQKVDADTVLGTTGKTGKATGVHLHLGLKRLSGGGYINPEAWAAAEYKAPSVSAPKPEEPEEPKTKTEAPKATVVTAKKEKVAKYKPQDFDKDLSKSYKVTANGGLNIRHGAGKSKTRMVTIPKNTKVRCYGYFTAFSEVKWLYVNFTYKGVVYTGFASSEYLKEV